MKTFFEGILSFFMMLIAAAFLWGWILNLVAFVNLDFEEPYKAEIIRGFGLSSYGAVIGYININDN